MKKIEINCFVWSPDRLGRHPAAPKRSPGEQNQAELDNAEQQPQSELDPLRREEMDPKISK